MNYTLFLRDNRLVGNILPEKPHYLPDAPRWNNVLERDYNVAHAKALSEALEVVNPEEFAFTHFGKWYKLPSPVMPEDNLKEGEYYAWPGEAEIQTALKCQYMEDDGNCTDCFRGNLCAKVKKLKLLPLSGTSQPEQKDIPEIDLDRFTKHGQMVEETEKNQLEYERNSAMSYTSECICISKCLKIANAKCKSLPSVSEATCPTCKETKPNGLHCSNSFHLPVSEGEAMVQIKFSKLELLLVDFALFYKKHGSDPGNDMSEFLNDNHLKYGIKVSEGETQEEQDILWQHVATIITDNIIAGRPYLSGMPSKFHITRIKK